MLKWNSTDLLQDTLAITAGKLVLGEQSLMMWKKMEATGDTDSEKVMTI